MKLLFETVAETQKNSLAAATDFADNCLIAAERLARLHIEVSRTALEQSSAMTLHCLESCLDEDNAFAWHAGVESGVEQFSRYCQAVCEIAQETAKQ